MSYIQEERLVQCFLDMIKIDSESYFEADMAEYVKKNLEDMELVYSEDEASEELKEICRKNLGLEGNPSNNIYVYLPGNLPEEKVNKEKSILLSSHMDTVSPGNQKKAVIHEDGLITTDGTTVLGADDLSGVAEILEVLRIYTEHDLPHPDIEVLFTPAEEPYCQGSRLADYSKIQSKMALVLDLSGEIGRAAYTAPSIYSVYIHVHGKASHAGSAPEKGIHALYIAAKAIAQLPYGHVEEETTVNFGTIQGGDGKNIVPEEVYLTGEIRSMKKDRVTFWAEEIRRVFGECAAELGGNVDVVLEKEFDAYRVEEKESVTQTFKKAALHLGIEPRLVETYGGSDCNNFCEHGIKGLVLANGMNEIHSVREYSRVSDLTKVCELLLEIISNL
ncbi:MAG: M20/M25/M40 family metallo-hydrolase [Eubacteriales bacterium]|nr:M20/M25/M40 family metallo-hydrolase [Eubacteriales bacterium]